MERRPASKSGSDSTEWWWIFDPRCSLRARAALLIGGGMLGFTLLLSTITASLYRRTIEAATGPNFESLAFQVGDKLDRTLYERYRTLHLAADVAPLRSENVTVAERRRLLEAVQAASPDFAWIGFANASGRVVAATNGLFEGAESKMEPWFLGAREFPFVGSLREIPALTRELPPADDGMPATQFLDLAVPVVDLDGRFAGVLAAHVRWGWSRTVQLSVVPESAVRERIGVTVYSANGEVLLDSGASGWSRPPDPPLLADVRRSRGSLLETTTGNSRYLTGYSRSRGFRDYRGLGWLTVVRQPLDRVVSAVPPLRRAINLWGFALAIAGGVAGWTIAGRHARRLRSVAAAADRIRTGDILAVLPRGKGKGETAHMCAALSELVEDLRNQRETLTTENDRLAAQARERDAARR